LLVSWILPKKEQNNLTYGTMKTLVVFVCFLEELKTPKSPFEINWPLLRAKYVERILPSYQSEFIWAYLKDKRENFISEEYFNWFFDYHKVASSNRSYDSIFEHFWGATIWDVLLIEGYHIKGLLFIFWTFWGCY
jgi:hypothetical protein